MYPAVLLIYFISAAVILLVSLALTVQVSLPYNKTGRASVLYNRDLHGALYARVFTRFCYPFLRPLEVNKHNTRAQRHATTSKASLPVVQL